MFGDTTFQTAYHQFHKSIYPKVRHPNYVVHISIIARKSSILLSRKIPNSETYIPCLSLLNSNGEIQEIFSNLRQ